MTKKLKYVLKGILIGALVGGVLSAGLFAASTYLHGRFPGRTVIANIDLGYMTIEEATRALKQGAQAFEEKGLIFTANGKEANIKPSELGIEFLPEETVATISRIDLKKSFLPFSPQTNQLNASNPILFTIDQHKLQGAVDAKLGLTEIAPQNSHFEIDKSQGLTATQEKSGLSANYDKLLAELEATTSLLTPKKIDIELRREEPVISASVLEKEKEGMKERLRKTITISNGKFTQEFKTTDHLSWIEFGQVVETTLPNINMTVSVDAKYIPESYKDVKRTVTISLNDIKFNKFVDEQIAPKIEIKVEPVSIYKNKQSKIVIEGRGRDGVEVQRDSFKKALELAVNQGVAEVEIATTAIEAPVTISSDIQDLGIKELLGVGHTSYYGSPPNRIHNIQNGVNKFNGVLIAKDEEFSFNTTLGPVDDTTGYKKELVIKGDETIPEYGGGLCQVSTTMYRAAMFSGLPITDRAPHSYAVSYYSQILGHGLDATIYLGGQDLKFKNDTERYILVQAYVDDMNAYFKFYGTSDGRKVIMDGPVISNHKGAPAETLYAVSDKLAAGQTKQVEKRINGFDAYWTRTIEKEGQDPIKEEIKSRYRAMQAKILVAPGDSHLAKPAEAPVATQAPVTKEISD